MDLTRISLEPVELDITTALPNGAPTSIDSVTFAILPYRTVPSAATVWLPPASFVYPTAAYSLAGPDVAPAAGRFVAPPGETELWMRAAVGSTFIRPVHIDRINVLGGGPIEAFDMSTLPDAVAAGLVTGPTATQAALDGRYVNEGQGAGGALSGSYPSPGLNETTVDSIVAGKVPGPSSTATALRAAFGPFDFAVAKVTGDGTTDDGPTINTAMTTAVAAGVRRVIVPAGATGAVAVGTKLVIPSGATLEISHGVTLVRKATLGGNLIVNNAVDNAGRDSNIGLILGVGSLIDCGTPAAGTTGSGLHGIRFRRCDGLTVRGAGATSVIKTTGGKYALSLGDVTGYTVDSLGFTAASDGAHIAGPSLRGRVANLWGTSVDDFVAVTPRDWTAYDDVNGDVTDLVIENLYGTSTAATVLKLLGGSAAPLTALRRVSARNIFGAAGTSGILVGDDTSQANTTGGLIDAVSIENVRTTVPNAQSVLWITASNLAALRIHGVHFNNSAATVPIIRIVDHGAPAGTMTYGTVMVSDVNVIAMGASAVLSADSLTRVNRLQVDRLTVASTASGGTPLQLTGQVDDLIARGIQASLSNAYVLSLGAPATAAVTRAVLSGITVTSTGGGGLVVGQTSGQAIANLDITGCSVTGTAWLFDVNGTYVINMTSVTHKTPGSGIANIRAGANVTFRGDGMTLGSGNISVTAGGAVHAFSLGFPCDVSKLTRDANGLATNTNAGLACGAGPVVSNGTTWKHLHTGATY